MRLVSKSVWCIRADFSSREPDYGFLHWLAAGGSPPGRQGNDAERGTTAVQERFCVLRVSLARTQQQLQDASAGESCNVCTLCQLALRSASLHSPPVCSSHEARGPASAALLAADILADELSETVPEHLLSSRDHGDEEGLPGSPASASSGVGGMSFLAGKGSIATVDGEWLLGKMELVATIRDALQQQIQVFT